ncbi:MAG: peptide chain release factor-like protein [Elusimicrobia bacterium]|nr:peptide chain release factor-like protein [Elusimicrobiota bacterium]
MDLHESFAVTPSKLEALKERIHRLGISVALIKEQFVKGSGAGGQKINKTANAVVLRYPPLGLVVRCQRERQRNLNRFLALRELVDRVEIKLSPQTSRRLQEWSRTRDRKLKRRQRSRKKYSPA